MNELLEFLKFLHYKEVFCGVRNEKFNIFRNNTAGLQKKLAKDKLERSIQFKGLKCRYMLQRADFKTLGNSKHAGQNCHQEKVIKFSSQTVH